MSWETKQDYCGLETANKLVVKSANENKSGQYLEKHGRTGAYAATKVFGVRSAPQNTYTVQANHTFTGKSLGTVNTVSNKKFALASVSWSTGADEEPTVSATAAEVASGATTHNTFAIPEFEISPDHVAQIPSFKFPVAAPAQAESVPAFTITGDGCELTNCSGEIACDVKTNDKNGLPLAYDVTNGRIVLNITIGQYGENVPGVTEASGWDVSSPLTSDDPDSDTPTWTMTLSHPLNKTMAA